MLPWLVGAGGSATDLETVLSVESHGDHPTE
jgi:hypothetical protein